MKANNKNYATRIFQAFSAMIIFVPHPGFAQEGMLPKGKALEEILVTAQRREENVQDVAISISVFNPEQIANANMTNASDLATYTPSLSTNTRFGNENTSFSLRGFTQALRTAASVATYFAEVVAPRGQTSQTSGDGAGPGYFYDLQNIQVLKGPQGTLFGRNTTGGAVLLVPNRPTDEFEGYAEYSTGNFGQKRAQGVLNLPLSNSLKARLGVDKSERDGHLNNITGIGAKKLGNTDYIAARLSLDWSITEKLNNYTILNYVDSSSNGYTARLYACNPNTDPSSNTFYALSGPSCAAQLPRQKGFYDLVSTIKTPVTKIQEKRFINTTSWNINDDLTITNILAYAHLTTENGSDIFGTQFTETLAGLAGLGPLALSLPAAADPRREFSIGVSVVNPDVPVTSQKTWIEELRAQGLAFDGRMTWQTGLYYEESSPDGYSGNNSAGLISCELATVEQNDPDLYNCFDATNGVLGSVLQEYLKTTFKNKAAYAQATYDIFEGLSVTLGARYTEDETSGHGIKIRYPFIGSTVQSPLISETTPSIKSTKPTGMLEINYHPMEGVMVYGKYTRGYRQGSINLAADPGLDTSKPEYVDTFEVGSKTSFGGIFPGYFNLSVFTNTLHDMQLQYGYISSTSGPTTTIANAGEAKIDGVEAETMLELYEGLTLNVSYSYLDTELVKQLSIDPQKVQDAVDSAGGNGTVSAQTATPIADEGDELPYAAKYSWVASLNYQLPVPQELGMMSVGATYVRTGKMRAGASSASPYSMLPGYELLNLNASWFGILGSNFDLSLYGTNVTDEEYLTYNSATYNTLSFDSVQTGLPKTYGARLRYSF